MKNEDGPSIFGDKSKSEYRENRISKLMEESIKVFELKKDLNEAELAISSISKETQKNETEDDKRVRSLAIQLQDYARILRELEKLHYDNLKGKAVTISDKETSTNEKDKALQNSNTKKLIQDLEIENLELIGKEREEKIDHIVASIMKLNTIFKQMNHLVLEQGTIIDRIDYHLEHAKKQTEKGKDQLHKASDIQKTSGANKCILILAALNIIFLAVVLIKYIFFK